MSEMHGAMSAEKPPPPSWYRWSVLVVISLALGTYVHPYWYFFTAFVGLNLFQSAFTNWCPMMTFLRKLGAKDTA